MMSCIAATEEPVDRHHLLAALLPFQMPSLRRSLGQFASTLIAYLAVNVAMYALVPVSPWLPLP